MTPTEIQWLHSTHWLEFFNNPNGVASGPADLFAALSSTNIRNKNLWCAVHTLEKLRKKSEKKFIFGFIV